MVSPRRSISGRILFLQMMSDLKEDSVEKMEDDVEGSVINAEIADDLFEFDPETLLFVKQRSS